MRLVSFLLMFLLLACAGSKKVAVLQNELDGDWIPTHQEIGGKALPAAAFVNQVLTLKDSSYTFIAESVDKGIARTNGNKMDIYGKEGVNKGKHFTAIFKLENAELTICYNLAGTEYPDSLSSRGKPFYFLSAFRKK